MVFFLYDCRVFGLNENMNIIYRTDKSTLRDIVERSDCFIIFVGISTQTPSLPSILPIIVIVNINVIAHKYRFPTQLVNFAGVSDGDNFRQTCFEHSNPHIYYIQISCYLQMFGNEAIRLLRYLYIRLQMSIENSAFVTIFIIISFALFSILLAMRKLNPQMYSVQNRCRCESLTERCVKSNLMEI